MDNINTSRLSNEELFRRYPMINTSGLDYGIAEKTKPIKAKHISSLLVDNSVLSKFLIETLEGKESLNGGSIICLGDAGDIWQQAPKKLLDKYTVSEITEDGWMVCQPKKGNQCLVYKVTQTSNYVYDGFCIIGSYGEERVLAGKKVYLQFGLFGDYVLGNMDDESDRWIVRASLFDQTYQASYGVEAQIIKMTSKK